MKKRSLSARKKNLKQATNFLKDKNIKKTFKKFTNSVKNLSFKNNVCVALSGGPDSLGLLYLVKSYKFPKNTKVYVYIVDHLLRKKSSEEAHFVKSKVSKLVTNIRILKWTGEKPSSNIQASARQKRYFLISKQCKIDNVDTIFTGHHKDDLHENFLLRLLRGSGLQGIASFNSLISNYSDEIKIVRPLLNVKKEELIYISNNIFNFYIDDPSNKNNEFTRTRLRKLISKFKTEGLNLKKLNLTLNNLTSSNNAINFYVNKNLKENIHKNIHNNSYIISKNFFDFPEEIIFRSFSQTLKRISKKYYAPRGKSVLNLLNMLKLKKNLKITLSGCIIEKFDNSIVISREKVKKN
tara:strand:- start:122 stop:1177 length:1056 start_codon:yes stop_codon:yes gene_type:complete